MRARKYYKSLGKAAFKRNYWICVLVCLVLLILCGEGNYEFTDTSSITGQTSGTVNEVQDDSDEDSYTATSDQDIDADSDDVISLDKYFSDDSSDDTDSDTDMTDADTNDSAAGMSEDETEVSYSAATDRVKSVVTDNVMPIPFLSQLMDNLDISLLFMILAVIGLLLSIFVLPIIQIGGCRFFIENADEPASAKLLFSDFDGRYYLTHVLTYFLQSLFIILWTLLLVIPGIVKSYEYSMIEYLLADHPELSRKEAFRMSKELTNGNKWNLFVLDFSFILWDFLNAITLGILGVFWLNPYKHATKAEVYRDLYDAVYGNNAGNSNDTFYENNASNNNDTFYGNNASNDNDIVYGDNGSNNNDTFY